MLAKSAKICPCLHTKPYTRSSVLLYELIYNQTERLWRSLLLGQAEEWWLDRIFFFLFLFSGIGGFSLLSVPVLVNIQRGERHNRPVCTSRKYLSTDRKRRRAVSETFADFCMFYEHSASCFYTVWPWEFVKTAWNKRRSKTRKSICFGYSSSLFSSNL